MLHEFCLELKFTSSLLRYCQFKEVQETRILMGVQSRISDVKKDF